MAMNVSGVVDRNPRSVGAIGHGRVVSMDAMRKLTLLLTTLEAIGQAKATAVEGDFEDTGGAKLVLTLLLVLVIMMMFSFVVGYVLGRKNVKEVIVVREQVREEVAQMQTEPSRTTMMMKEKIVQSPVTFEFHWQSPRFRVLRDRDHGAWTPAGGTA